MATSQGRTAAQHKEGTKSRHAAGPVSQHPALEAQQADPDVLQRAIADPARARPADILALQRVTGNRAVSGLLVQAKLVVGPVGDRYEQEADRVADQVLNMSVPDKAQRQEEEEEVQAKPETSTQIAASITPLVQKQEEEEELQTKPLLQRQEEEEELQTKPLLQRQEEEEELQTKPLLQRQEEEEELQTKSLLQRQEEEEELQTKPLLQRQEEEEELQTKPLLQRQEEEEDVQMAPAIGIQRLPGGSAMAATPQVESAIKQARGDGQSLEDEVRAPMERAFGADFSGVRVHTDTGADALNRSLQAKAFTTGNDIFFRSGAYQPGSSSGQRLLAHELTHTMQQGASTRIARWAPLGTSHKEITEQAVDNIKDPDAKRFYEGEGVKKWLGVMAEAMDDREAGKPSFKGMLQGLLDALHLRKWLTYPVYRRMGAKTTRLFGKKRGLQERVRLWQNVEGYTRNETEQVNHAESGMYRWGEKEASASTKTWQRIDSWFDLALKEGANAALQGEKGNWSDAFTYLGLALHTTEDIGSHGHGIPGNYPKGHDPRRFVKPPEYDLVLKSKNEPLKQLYKTYYVPGSEFGDCDNAAKNPQGYQDALMLAGVQLEDFASYFVKPDSPFHKDKVQPGLKGKTTSSGWQKTKLGIPIKKRERLRGETKLPWQHFFYPKPTKEGPPTDMVYFPSKALFKQAKNDWKRRRKDEEKRWKRERKQAKEEWKKGRKEAKKQWEQRWKEAQEEWEQKRKEDEKQWLHRWKEAYADPEEWMVLPT